MKFTASSAQKSMAEVSHPGELIGANDARAISRRGRVGADVAAAGILHGLLPNSEVIILPDAGHLPMIEQPERCANDYLDFQKSLDRLKRSAQMTSLR